MSAENHATPPERPPLVVSDNLTKHFPMAGGHQVHALDGVSLTIHEREILGLVGESGSGKSTYGKTLIGLHDKTAGTVDYRGERLPQRYQTKDFHRHARTNPRICHAPEKGRERCSELTATSRKRRQSSA